MFSYANIILVLHRLLQYFTGKKKTNACIYDSYKIIDESYLASWNKADGQKILLVNEAARTGHITVEEAFKFYRDMETAIKRKWNDQSSNYEFIQPLAASYKFDKITEYGLSLFCALAVGKSAKIISHMGIGDGVGPTFDYQDVLYAEKIRYAVGEKGYFNSLGRSIRFHVTFDIMEPSYTFSEAGLFNNGTLGAGPMIARASFDPAVEHTSGYNYITSNYLINTLSA